jgi:hypothetical protein
MSGLPEDGELQLGPVTLPPGSGSGLASGPGTRGLGHRAESA